ncbi:MAG: immune inhibitor A [Anaerolineae bacterium]|nr:immune inhibitor A [Anaerolineae bacterium]
MADGTEVTTPDDYDDPNGRLSDYGGLKHGYTGDSGGWLRVYHDLSLYAGQPIKLRFRYATDAALQERGAFVDNIKITAGAQVILNDPVEGNNLNGWTPTVTTFVTGECPAQAGGPARAPRHPQCHSLEWRNLNGFDTGLKYTYNTVFAADGEWGRRVARGQGGLQRARHGGLVARHALRNRTP